MPQGLHAYTHGLHIAKCPGINVNSGPSLGELLRDIGAVACHVLLDDLLLLVLADCIQGVCCRVDSSDGHALQHARGAKHQVQFQHHQALITRGIPGGMPDQVSAASCTVGEERRKKVKKYGSLWFDDSSCMLL